MTLPLTCPYCSRKVETDWEGYKPAHVTGTLTVSGVPVPIAGDFCRPGCFVRYVEDNIQAAPARPGSM